MALAVVEFRWHSRVIMTTVALWLYSLDAMLSYYESLYVHSADIDGETRLRVCPVYFAVVVCSFRVNDHDHGTSGLMPPLFHKSTVTKHTTDEATRAQGGNYDSKMHSEKHGPDESRRI